MPPLVGGPRELLARTQCGDHGTAPVGEHGHVSVIRINRGVPAAEQPVQRSSHGFLGILMDPAIIIGIVRPIYPTSGPFAEKPQRVQLLLGDRHWNCRSSGRVLGGLLQSCRKPTRMAATVLPLRALPATQAGRRAQ